MAALPHALALSAEELARWDSPQFRALQLNKRIADGSRSTVWHAVWQSTPVAIKQLKAEACMDPAALRSFEQEFNIAAKLRHPAVCALYGTTVIGGAPAIVLEYMPGGSLHHALHNRHRHDVLRPDALSLIALDVAMGIAYLHSNQVIHRDVKAANVLLTVEGHAKVTDFGIATRFGPEHTAETGTYRFMAPEVISHQQYDMRCDTYSFGMLLWEMMHGEVPFRGCYAMLCYAMLCYAMLCYAVLCCAVLCCAMLCYAMRTSGALPRPAAYVLLGTS
jgi:serine/threonine protein kinase